MIPCVFGGMSYPELTWIHPVNSSDAVVVYNDVSENSSAGPSVVPPPSYDDLDF